MNDVCQFVRHVTLLQPKMNEDYIRYSDRTAHLCLLGY